jgi:hypothetical protein
MKKAFTILLITVLSFQLCLAETLLQLPQNRLPASALNLEQLTHRLDDFKLRIAGREEMPDCPGQEFSIPQNATSAVRDDYFLNRLQLNACSENRYTYEQENEETQRCEPIKTPGLIDQLVEEAMIRDQEGRDPRPLRLDDPVVVELHQEAQFLQAEVQRTLLNNRVDRTARQNLLLQYTDAVLVRMRDLIVIKRSYIDADEYHGRHFFETLRPEFPSDLVLANDTIDVNGISIRLVDRVAMGPNPAVDPFHLNIVEIGRGKSTLQFRDLDILSRDLMSLLKAPTSTNYLRALKWMTLQMMLSQLEIYKAVTDDSSATQLPLSCQSHRNGDLPAQMDVSLSEEVGQEYLENLLFSHGLLFDATDGIAVDYFLENIDRDPTQHGYSGLLGFEDYTVAKKGLAGEVYGPNRSSLDDIQHFETLFQLKFPKALEHYRGQIRPSRTRDVSNRSLPRRIHYAGIEEFNKIVSTPTQYEIFEVTNSRGSKFTLEPERQNLSTFLAEAMVRHSVLSFEDLIPERLRLELQQRVVAHSFPPLHGPHLWRQWGLNLLAEKLYDYKDVDRSHPVARAVERVCHFTYEREREMFCGNSRTKPVLALAQSLQEFSQNDEFLPLRRIEERQLEGLYPSLSNLWDILRDSTDVLPEAKTNEYDYLVSQMDALNPWARIRLGYLIHRDELQTARDSHTPVRVTNRRFMSRLAPESQCLYTQIDSRIEKLDKAARDMGVDQPLSILYADKIASSRERQYIWNTIVEEEENPERYAELFTEELGSRRAYDYLDEVSYKTFLSRDQVDQFLGSFPSLDEKSRTELEDVFNDETNGVREDLYRLYTLKGQPEQQVELLSQILRDGGIHDSLRVKLGFLMLDREVKAPLMKSIVRSAAEQRKEKIQESLNQFCNLEPDDFDNLRALFYSTSRAQNKINQLAGLPEVPEVILDRINSMSPEEWTNLWLGLGAGILGVGAVLVGGACAVVTGGLCAPLSAAMVAAGASAISMQLILVNREYHMKRDADHLESQVQMMEDLGFAGAESSYQVSRSWFWTALEGVFVIPLIGLSARAVRVGGKLFYTSSSHTLQASSTETFREAARTTLAEADVRMARYKLGMDHLGNTLSIQSLARGGADGAQASAELSSFLIREGIPEDLVQKTFQDIDHLRDLFATGHISMDNLVVQMARAMEPLQVAMRQSSTLVQRTLGQVTVRESKSVIDGRAAEVVANYFGHNPNGLLSLVKSYTGRRMNIASGRMAAVNNRTGVMNRIPIARNIVNWFRKIRSADLVNHAPDLARIESELTTLVQNGGDLQTYIRQNMEVLTDVFTNMPLRKRELPYFILFLGGPSVGGRLAGSKIPVVGTLTDGFMLRQLFSARSRLVYESLKVEAREALSLPLHVASESTFTAYKAFQYSLSESMKTMSDDQAQLLSRQFLELEEELVAKLHQNIVSLRADGRTFRFREGSQVHRLSQEDIRRIMMNPRNLEEKALSQVIWAAAEPDMLLNMEKLNAVALKAVEELASYRTVDEFQNYLSALKILVLKRDPAVVQFF